MGVAKDDDVGGGKFPSQALRRRRAELITVSHRDVQAVKLELCDLRAPRTDLESIGIAEHGSDRRQRLELGEQIVRTNIAGVQNVIDLREDVEDLGPEQAVSVGNNAESHA